MKDKILSRIGNEFVVLEKSLEVVTGAKLWAKSLWRIGDRTNIGVDVIKEDL